MSDTPETEKAPSVYDLLGPDRPLDYTDPAIQYALDCEAERRIRLRGLLGPVACKGLRGRIIKKFKTENSITA